MIKITNVEPKRKFDGKIYSHVRSVTDKQSKERWKAKYQAKGWKVRVVKATARARDFARGGTTAYTVYDIYVNKSRKR